MNTVQKLTKQNISEVARIASESFSGLKSPKNARQWIDCNVAAFPRMQYFVAMEEGEVTGYVLWVEKGGFRSEAVFELEQIAVDKNHQRKGIATRLVKESLQEIRAYVQSRGAKLKLVEVTTGTDNAAQELYKKTLGAKSEAVIKNFFRSDEAVMIARFK